MVIKRVNCPKNNVKKDKLNKSDSIKVEKENN